jgi:DNA-binding NtrC family response regulator
MSNLNMSDFSIFISYGEARAQYVGDFEKRYVSWLMEKHSGNISAAARSAGMDRKHLRDLAKKHGIDYRIYRGKSLLIQKFFEGAVPYPSIVAACDDGV